MFNRLFILTASMVTSLVLAYAHLGEWWNSTSGKEQKTAVDIVHFHEVAPVLQPTHLLLFGIVFLIFGVLSLVFALLKKHRNVFFCFVGCMITIWIRLWVAGT